MCIQKVVTHVQLAHEDLGSMAQCGSLLRCPTSLEQAVALALVLLRIGGHHEVMEECAMSRQASSLMAGLRYSLVTGILMTRKH